MPESENCPVGIRNQVRINGLGEKEIEQDRRMDKLDTLLEKAVMRLPPWAVLLIGGLAATCGFLLNAWMTAAAANHG